jgi:hypothetical protein
MLQMLFISHLHEMGLESICIMLTMDNWHIMLFQFKNILMIQSTDDGLDEDLMQYGHLEVQA